MTPKVEANAKFKLIEINSINGTSDYNLIGETTKENEVTKKASINQKITDENLQNFAPGMIIPCKVDGSGGELKIPMIAS